MFEKLGGEQLKVVSDTWSRCLKGEQDEIEVEEVYWYKAEVKGVKKLVRKGNPLVQFVFSVGKKRLVKDFWLTERGIYVFRDFLRKMGVVIESLEDLHLSLVFDREIQIFIGKTNTWGNGWMEITGVREVE